MFTRRNFIAGLLGVSLLATTFSAPVFAQELEFRIGYQKASTILLVAKQRGSLEKRLKDLGVTNVKWVEFQFGPPIIEALNAGALDLGALGDIPPISAQAAGSDLVYVAATPAATTAIVVPKGSAIQKVEDLKGKRIAFGKGSTAHNLTIQALRKHGLDISDIEPVYLTPADAGAAFATGRVDAWAIWDPYFALAETRHNARPIAQAGEPGLETSSFYLSTRSYAEANPAVVKAALEEIKAISDEVSKDREGLAKIASETTGFDLEAQTIATRRQTIDLLPVTDEVLERQQKIADTFAELKLIPRPVKVRDAVWNAPTN